MLGVKAALLRKKLLKESDFKEQRPQGNICNLKVEVKSARL